MRKKFLKEFKKNLRLSNFLWEDDINEIIHLANISFKKSTKELKEYRKLKKWKKS